MNKKVKLAKERMDGFNARGSNCPICGKKFRDGYNHSVNEAKDKLNENYVKAIFENIMSKRKVN